MNPYSYRSHNVAGTSYVRELVSLRPGYKGFINIPVSYPQNI